MKRKIVDNYMLFIMLVVLAFVLYIGFTFAWFKPDVDGEGKNMIVETGSLSLHFQDGPEIIAKEIMPGWTTSKTFTVTNTGTLSTYYTLWWKDFENTFKNDEFVYSLTCKSYSDYDNKVEGGNCFGFDEKPVNTPEDLRILSNTAIDSGYTHEYIITVEYIETPYVQNYNQGKRFYGLINIKEYYVNEADVAELQTYSFGNKELSATIVDSYGIVAYGLSYPSASLSVDDVNWINVDNKTTFNLTISIADYRVILWIKNKIGNVVYFNLTPHPTLIVDPNGGTWNNNIAPQTYNMTYEETKFIMEPTKEGYIFDYWTMETEGTESSLYKLIFTMGEKNVRLIANYALAEFQLTIDPNGGKYNGNSNTYSSMVEYKKEINIATPERTGYTFVGWEVSSDKATLNTNIFKIGKEDCTLTANWQVNDYPWIAYHNKMNTDGNGYTLVDADTERGQANYGSKVTPTVKTYTGFNSPSAIELTISEVETNNIINYNYERQKYNLIINPNTGMYQGSANNTTLSVYYEQNITLDTPTREGYNFNNWTLTGGGSIADSVFTGGFSETTLSANFTPIQSTITFNANGGGTPSFTTKTVTYNSEYGELPEISRDGYEFIGWFTAASGGVEIYDTKIVDITSSTTLYAQWKQQLKVIANTNGGTLSQTFNTNYEPGTIIALEDPTRVGYTFNGWTATGTGSAILGERVHHCSKTATCPSSSCTQSGTNCTCTSHQWVDIGHANSASDCTSKGGGSWSSSSHTCYKSVSSTTTSTISCPSNINATLNGTVCDAYISDSVCPDTWTDEGFSETSLQIGTGDVTLTANWLLHCTKALTCSSGCTQSGTNCTCTSSQWVDIGYASSASDCTKKGGGNWSSSSKTCYKNVSTTTTSTLSCPTNVASTLNGTTCHANLDATSCPSGWTQATN